MKTLFSLYLHKIRFLLSFLIVILGILCLFATAIASQEASIGDFGWFVEMEKLFYDIGWEKTWQKIEDEAKQKNQILIPIFDGSARVMVARVATNDQARLRAIGIINSKYWTEVANRWQATGKGWKAIARFFENSPWKLSPLLDRGDEFQHIPAVEQMEKARDYALLWSVWYEHIDEVSTLLKAGESVDAALWKLGKKYPSVPVLLDPTKPRTPEIGSAKSYANTIEVIIPRPSGWTFMEGRPPLPQSSFVSLNVQEIVKSFIRQEKAKPIRSSNQSFFPPEDQTKYWKDDTKKYGPPPPPPPPPDKGYAVVKREAGGVIFDKNNTYNIDQTGKVTKLTRSALQSRPQEESISWEFNQEGKSYKAVTVPLGKTKESSTPQRKVYYDNKEKIVVSIQDDRVIALKCVQSGSYLHILQIAEGKRIEGTSGSDKGISFIVSHVVLTDYGLK